MTSNSRLKRKKVVVVFFLLLVIVLSLVYFYVSPPSVLKMTLEQQGEKGFLRAAFSILGEGDGKKSAFQKPYGVAIDDLGKVYITDIERHRVSVFTRQGKFLYSFGKRGVAHPPIGEKATWRPGDFLYPAGLDVDAIGQVYVVDSGNRRINVYNSEGKFIRFFPEKKILVNPTMIAVHSGKVYVCDTGGIRLFTDEGRYLGIFGEKQLAGPTGIAIDREGRIYVADILKNAVFCFSPRRQVLWEFSGRVGGKRKLGFPFGVALDNQNKRLFVADALRHRVYALTFDGELLTGVGRLGSAPLEFAFPRGLAFSPNGYLFVADSSNQRVQALQVLNEAFGKE
jgi:DNA-binding beta-propeller fold protein YncE